RGIQGVPSVWLNGLPFADGKIDAGQIVNKLLEMYPDLVSDATAAGDARDSDDDNLYDMAVIGGGPAGVSAAIYAARKGLRVTLVADRLGGQVKDTMAIENLIAVHKTTGPELSADLAENLRAYGVDVKEHLRVTQIGSELADDGCRTIVLNTGDRLRTRAVILATGAQWRQLNVPGEKEYLGKGVAYCPHCDGPFFKGKDVAVIGGGNSGVEAALDLSGIVRSVKLIEFAPRFNADSILLDRVAKTANIESIANAQTIAINGDGQKMTGLRYVDRESGAEHELELDGVFVQIGLIPNTEFVRNLVEVNRFGEIVVDDRCQTNREGIFACGDATVTPYKQIVVALGEGAKAALSAFDYLMKLPTDSPALRAS
ncbi:MAG: alkyl hydroperoxide reductase subunit F, partial [Leptospiraceae bacterium]|nr:alkyl hydroperoxide reductase subunit F [Leptospiraceae bacterium]